jgi:serine/threonine protein kinase
MNELTAGMLIGNYKLVALVGKGNMGEVWRAVDDNGEDVALKTIANQTPDEGMLRERFLREAANHQRLRHPAIVPIREFFDYEDRLYLIMHYIPGGSLEDRLLQLNGAPLPVSEAIAISRQILGALDYAHQQLIIHRDVKPSNILMCEGQAFLADFGISVPIGGPRLTTARQLVGTRFYMSPEQIMQPLAITHLTDVFSFGSVLYEMLTGRQPFATDGDEEATSDYAAQSRQINAAATPPSELNPSIPERLEEVVLTALAKQPRDRFPGCSSFAKAIQQAMRAPEAAGSAQFAEASAPEPKREKSQASKGGAGRRLLRLLYKAARGC